ncbi:MAG: hypothetical protein ACR2PJ_00630 [Pseudomonadales bacterium]
MKIITIAKSLGAAALVMLLAGSIAGCFGIWPDCGEGYYYVYDAGHCRANDGSHSVPPP